MRSHQYQFTLRDLSRALLPTLCVLAGAALLLNVGARQHLLPAPPAGWDSDSGVLVHQSLACRKPSDAQVLVVGDSTCLVGVDARALSRLLPQRTPVLSLALFIWLDLGVYGQEVADFATAHPGQVRAVVLLVSPAKLGGMAQDSAGQEFWRDLQRHGPVGPGAAAVDWLGGKIWRWHFLSHLLETPLRGGGAAFYGFASESVAYMTAHSGSLANPGTVTPFRNPARALAVTKFELAPAMEAESRLFRSRMPAGAKLLIGLTPRPRGLSSPSSRAERDELLRQWNQWVQADILLTNLPPTLPDVFFAGGGHLNPVGQKRFTAELARELREVLPAPAASAH